LPIATRLGLFGARLVVFGVGRRQFNVSDVLRPTDEFQGDALRTKYPDLALRQAHPATTPFCVVCLDVFHLPHIVDPIHSVPITSPSQSIRPRVTTVGIDGSKNVGPHGILHPQLVLVR